jgi:hypothetical protein
MKQSSWVCLTFSLLVPLEGESGTAKQGILIGSKRLPGESFLPQKGLSMRSVVDKKESMPES